MIVALSLFCTCPGRKVLAYLAAAAYKGEIAEINLILKWLKPM